MGSRLSLVALLCALCLFFVAGCGNEGGLEESESMEATLRDAQKSAGPAKEDAGASKRSGRSVGDK